MPGSITCGNCGEPVPDEHLGDNPAQAKPCPKCGSTARSFNVHIEEKLNRPSDSFELRVVPYPQGLLSVARSLIGLGHFGIAVIVAHMACEVATERKLSEAFSAKGIQNIESAVLDFLNGYNLANDRIRNLYTALTGDAVQNAGFWQDFRTSAQRRNGVMHAGKIVGKSEAEESLKAATDLVAHLGQ